jgi:hypothetical protein
MDNYAYERRRQARLERLGTNDPHCAICGESDPCCLDLHHVGGRVFACLIIVCATHHRKLEEKKKAHPRASDEPTTLEYRGYLLLGIADFLEELPRFPLTIVATVRETGLHLIDYAQAFRPQSEDERP